MKRHSRRDFSKLLLQTTCAVSAAGWTVNARAIEPFRRSGPAHFQLSLAAYSFRDFFKDSNHPQKPSGSDRQMDMFKFVDYCAEHGCTGAELTSYYFPAQLNDAYLIELHRHAFLRGVAISGTAVGNDFTMPEGPERAREIALVKTWVDRAAILGAPHIRVFAGAGKSVSAGEARRRCIGALEECGDYAGKKGVFLGLENHGGIVAEPQGMLEIVRAVKSKWVGVNLDTGNFHSSPYEDLAACAPYAVNVQYKTDLKFKEDKRAQPANPSRIIRILRDANYQGYVALEYEGSEDPWTAVPRHLKELQAAFAG